MVLEQEHKRALEGWIADGASLSEVQRRLKEEFQIALTYMDVRLLVDDLKLQLIEEQPKQSEAAERIAAAKQEGEMQREGAAATGGVVVSMDRITKPHALASGKVTFSDGETAEWMLDQTGRLGLVPAKPGYHPSQSDVLAFQQELQRVARGFA
jgi:hypothetical protein